MFEKVKADSENANINFAEEQLVLKLV